MIKFFRKIRQNLLSEGKTGKYLKYAIGEIVLVVIGILIALQINNWNEDRKNTDQFSQYLKAIKESVQDDLTELDSLKIRRTNNIENCKKERYLILKNEFDFNTTKVAASEAYTTYYFSPNLSAFEALSNSSVLGKLNGTDLNHYFADYQSQVSRIHLEEKSTNDMLEVLNTSVAVQGNRDPTLIMASYLLSERELDSLNVSLEGIEQSFQQLQESSAYRKVISENVLLERILLPEYEKLDKIGKQVISAINDVIK